MKRLKLFASLVAFGIALPAIAPRPVQAEPVMLAGLFRAIDIAEDVDDALDGDFGQIDPVREVTESVGDAADDVGDTIYDATHFNLYEPFTDIDDTVEEFNDDIDDTIRHTSNDVNDWFDW
jgi:hypothetical protein